MRTDLEAGGDAAAGPVHVLPPVEHVVGADEQHGGPAQPGLQERELLPGERGGHGGQRAEAEHGDQREAEDAGHEEALALPGHLLRAVHLHHAPVLGLGPRPPALALHGVHGDLAPGSRSASAGC